MADTNEKLLVKLFKVVGEISQTVGGAAGLLSFFQAIKPAAGVVLDNLSPEMAARIKRNSQRGSDGPVDDVNFLRTLMLLDGDDPNQTNRPLADNLLSYLTWLMAKNTELAVVFVYVTGLAMEDDERLRFLMRLAHVRDANGDGKSDAANQLRYDFTQTLEAFRAPEGAIVKFFKNHPEIKQQIADFKNGAITAVNTTVINPVKEFERGLQAADQQLLGDNSDFGKATLGYLDRARRRAGR